MNREELNETTREIVELLDEWEAENGRGTLEEAAFRVLAGKTDADYYRELFNRWVEAHAAEAAARYRPSYKLDPRHGRPRI